MIWFRGAYFSTPPDRSICYAAVMTAKLLKDVLERAEKWPEEAQTELAQIALEIDAGLMTGKYRATPAELAGIDHGLKAAREGRFATDDQVDRIFQKASSCMKVVFTDEALANLDGILSFIASNYPSIYDAFQSRLRSVVARIGDWPESAQEVADRPGLVAD